MNVATAKEGTAESAAGRWTHHAPDEPCDRDDTLLVAENTEPSILKQLETRVAMLEMKPPCQAVWLLQHRSSLQETCMRS